jgi:predicted GIY-YIG superfamily endonuclease
MGAKARSPARTHSVYVVRLDRSVLQDRRFARENPDHDPRKPCVYVGSTGLTPEERFANHKAGIRAGRGLVKRYGEALMPGKYSQYNPMTWPEAVKREELLAERLRRKGYAVWQR